MKFNSIPTLNRWAVLGNCLVGYIFDHKDFENGSRIVTDAIRFIDELNNYAECLDGKYRLYDPGTIAEHNSIIIGGKVPDPRKPKIDHSIFLNPRG